MGGGGGGRTVEAEMMNTGPGTRAVGDNTASATAPQLGTRRGNAKPPCAGSGARPPPAVGAAASHLRSALTCLHRSPDGDDRDRSWTCCSPPRGPRPASRMSSAE